MNELDDAALERTLGALNAVFHDVQGHLALVLGLGDYSPAFAVEIAFASLFRIYPPHAIYREIAYLEGLVPQTETKPAAPFNRFPTNGLVSQALYHIINVNPKSTRRDYEFTIVHA